MADTKISALTGASTPLAGTEVLPIVQSSATVKVSVANLTAGRAISATQLTLTTGNVIVASGQGVDFSATAGTGTSELLADYEEGTWTPTQGAGLTVVGAFSSAGIYTKTGRLVSVYGNVSGATSVAITANTVLCAGLPFAASAVVTYPVGSIVAQGLSQVGTVIVAASSIYAPTITATPVMYFSCTYFV